MFKKTFANVLFAYRLIQQNQFLPTYFEGATIVQLSCRLKHPLFHFQLRSTIPISTANLKCKFSLLLPQAKSACAVHNYSDTERIKFNPISLNKSKINPKQLDNM